jgi:hypothetical protein
MSATTILIVVDSINVNDSSGSRANMAIIQNLRDSGFQITVVHSTYKEIEIPGVKTISVGELKSDVNYWLSRTQRVMQRNFKWPLHRYQEAKFGFSFTFFNDVNRFRNVLQKFNSNQFDLIITLSKGGSFRPHGAVLKLQNWHHKWLAYIHDPYPSHLYPEPYTWTEPGHKIKEAFMQKIARNAQWVAFPSQLLLEHMSYFIPAFKAKSFVIPHQSESTQNNSTRVPDYFNAQFFNIVHAGNLMKQRDPLGLINGFKNFLQKNNEAQRNARLLLIGPASYHQLAIENAIKDTPQIVFLPKGEPYYTILGIQNAASVNIILEADAAESPFLPAKMVNCVAAQKAILHLGPKQSETIRLLGDTYPWHARISDSKQIAETLQTLFEQFSTGNLKPDYPVESLNQYFGASHLKQLIFDVCLNRK